MGAVVRQTPHSHTGDLADISTSFRAREARTDERTAREKRQNKVLKCRTSSRRHYFSMEISLWQGPSQREAIYSSFPLKGSGTLRDLFSFSFWASYIPNSVSRKIKTRLLLPSFLLSSWKKQQYSFSFAKTIFLSQLLLLLPLASPRDSGSIFLIFYEDLTMPPNICITVPQSSGHFCYFWFQQRHIQQWKTCAVRMSEKEDGGA